MTNKTTNTQPFKVKCIDGSSGLTLGKEYDAVGVEVYFYTIENDNGTLQSYFQERFEIVGTPIKDKQEFSKDDVSLVGDASLLSHQEVVQAVIDGKELEIQYKTGKWADVIPTKTTLHQLVSLNFRLKQSLGDKRKAVIKKLLESKVAVLCKCWDDGEGEAIVAITKVDDDFVYPYVSHDILYQNAYAIDDNGNEITNV